MSAATRAPYAVIGHALPRPDAWEKVHGRPIYAGDFVVPGMLHGRIVRSPYASARVVAIDTTAAAAVPGVAAVLTHADVPRNAMRMALPGRMAEATAEARPAFQPVLAEDRVRFQGGAGGGHRGRDAGGGGPGRRARPRGLRGAPGRLRPAGRACPGRARGPCRRQPPPPLASPPRRHRRGLPAGGRDGRAHLSHALHRPRVHGDRDRRRLDRRRGRRRPAGQHAGAGAFPRRGRRAGPPAQPRPDRGRVPGRRLRREGGRHRRVPARPPRVEDPPPGPARVLARGVVHRPREAPSLPDPVPDWRDPARRARRRSPPSSPPIPVPTRRSRRGSCSTVW